ncbi:MAG TPA: hypothetical protein DEF34_05570 [Desulfotomaculum sp.]|nr:MAG: hypothetical protein VR67_07160 [Peptococcaceae bacterium BRH_c8a]KJS73604.1 MAG: hypothetical protein JL56_10995 [Desulfotomaculum sp. BICA1-6]HBX23085.1 hypothetical protein [Desulfotomaculum sp.]
MRAVYIKTGIIAALICVQTASALTAWTMLNNFRGDGGIPRGIKISGVPAGGLTKLQAEKLFEETFGGEFKDTLIIQAAGQSVHIRPEAVDARLDYAYAIKQALDLKEQATGLTGALRELALLAGLYDIPLTLQFNHDKMTGQLAELKNLVDKAPRGATLTGDENGRILVPEQTGQYIDVPATLDKLRTIRPPLPDTIQAVVVRKEAPVKTGDLEPLRNILGECVTELNPNQVNRTANIALAVNALHDTLVKPGAVFSFNDQVGERSAENGFKNAPVIDGTRTVQGLGGGVCQVSTTLYNALLAANLDIVERQPHTRPVGYVSPGLDATVADGQIDLRFRNDRSFPILINGTLEDGNLRVRLWGVKSDNEPRIDIEANIQTVNPKTLIHQEPSLPRGSQVVQNPGKRGYVALVYKVAKGSYGETRQLITRDYYQPESKVILAGTGGSTPDK